MIFERRAQPFALAAAAAVILGLVTLPASPAALLALLIAAAGLRAFRAGVRGDWSVNADASLPLDSRHSA